MSNLRGGLVTEEHSRAEDKVCKPKKNPDGTDLGHIIKFARTSTQAERDLHLAEVAKLNRPYTKYFKGLVERLEPDEFSTETDDFYAYYGLFHPLVMDFIKQQAIVVRIEEDNWAISDEDDMAIHESQNWSASRISLTEERFNQNPRRDPSRPSDAALY